jgi:hypothetical protein
MKTHSKSSKRRTTKFAAGLVALSIAISGASALPARAGDEDVAKIIGGLATLFIVGKAIENSKSKSKAKAERDAQVSRSGHTFPSRGVGRFGRTNAFEVPNSCVMSVQGKHHRIQTVAVESCVMRERRSAVPLPRACETKVRTKHARFDAYDVGCLNNFGYRVTRAHDRNDRDDTNGRRIYR